jgi:hypothetical protein
MENAVAPTECASIIQHVIDHARRPLGTVDAVDIGDRPWHLETDLLRSLTYDDEFLASMYPLINGVEAGATAIPVNNYLFDRTVYTFLAQPAYYPSSCMELIELIDLLPPLQFHFPGINNALHADNIYFGSTSAAQELIWDAALVRNAYSDLRHAIAV